MGFNERRIRMEDKQGKSTATVTIDTSTDKVQGVVLVTEQVVATIAGLAAREVDGIHVLGTGGWFSFGDNPTRGVEVEVGQRQVAVDLTAVIGYGHDMQKVARGVRQRVAHRVETMTGKEVVEVNLHVADIEVSEHKPKKRPRVE